MDLASKCLKNVAPRVEQQIVRLFDALKIPVEFKEKSQSIAHLLKNARKSLDSIRSLFLEHM
jgi:predicted RNA binding protein with dsRBD fold (UPF0201 family)